MARAKHRPDEVQGLKAGDRVRVIDFRQEQHTHLRKVRADPDRLRFIGRLVTVEDIYPAMDFPIFLVEDDDCSWPASWLHRVSALNLLVDRYRKEAHGRT